MPRKNLTLAEWIDAEGTKTVAEAIRVDVSTVRHWRRGYVLPRTEQMLSIYRLSQGAVSIHSMVEHHHSKKNQKNRFQR